MTKFKCQNKLEAVIRKLRFVILSFSFAFFALRFAFPCFAQNNDLEFTLDAASTTKPLPKIFRPNIDLSGRGFHWDATWPQELAAKEALGLWQKEIGFSGLYRMQYNLWEINEFAKNKDLQKKLLDNYESVIKNISDAGGVVILDLFGTPAGLGKILDKKSSPWDFKTFKALIKGVIRELSCKKKYNIWYEVWNAPDLDDFFLGRKQEYLNVYRAVAESIKELEEETKINIPVGGPSVSWWSQSMEGNTIITPERSLIYDLIRFCYRYRLPLDFVSWHEYSTDPAAEKENTIYKKPAVKLIRDWLNYFRFKRETMLIVDEWNFDLNANMLAERKEKSFIAASYIPARIKNMQESGIDNQVYFCLEDFQNNKEGVVRNVGAFTFDPERSEYKGSPKAIFNSFRMLNLLGKEIFPLKLEDEFLGAIATRTKDGIAILLYNYIDPEIVTNYLSKNISILAGSERKFIINTIQSDRLAKIMQRQLEIPKLRTTKRVKVLLKKAQGLSDLAKKFESTERTLKFSIKNLKGDYSYQRYTVDSGSGLSYEFLPKEEKEIADANIYQESLFLKPYSLNLIILKKNPEEAQAAIMPAEKTKEAVVVPEAKKE